MRIQTLIIGALAMLGASCFIVGCNSQKSGQDEHRVVETVQVVPGKSLSPRDQAKISSLADKVVGHIAKAQEDIKAKNADGAKKELTDAETLLNMIKEVLPTVKIIDRIQVTNSSLSYVDIAGAQPDLVPILSSIDQIYDVLPEGKAKEHVKQAKNVLTKEKHKGAPKALEEFEAAEEALDFREADLSVSHTSRLVKAAQEDLEKGKTKEAADALSAVIDGVVFYETTVVDPTDTAARRIWIATQDYANKNYKAAQARLAKAKTALQDVAQNGSKSQQETAKHLISEIDTIDASKAGDKTRAALETLWHDARNFMNQSQIKGKK